MNDAVQLVPMGVAANKGFETFQDTLYTMFQMVTTANLPGAILPSFEASRPMGLFFFLYLFITIAVFLNVVLASVYDEYKRQMETLLGTYFKKRAQGMMSAFLILCNEDEIISQDSFVDLVRALNTGYAFPSITENLISCVFNTVDRDHSGTIDKDEFYAVVVTLRYRFDLLPRDSRLKAKAPQFWDSRLMRTLRLWVENGALANCGLIVLSVNTVFVVVESVYLFEHWTEPSIFGHLELFFCFIYLFEVVINLMVIGFGEYWYHPTNRFDFMSTIILCIVGVLVVLPFIDVGSKVARYANMFRLLRLVRILQRVPALKKIVTCLVQMVTASGDALTMNLIVLLCWSALGNLLWGGGLYTGNPALKGTDYIKNHLEVYNFNDPSMGCLTLLLILLTGYQSEIVAACGQLSGDNMVVALVFFISFWVVSILWAFNVFIAFAIEAYQHIADEHRKQVNHATQDLAQLDALKLKHTEQGHILRVTLSPELRKMKVQQRIFDERGLVEEKAKMAVETEHRERMEAHREARRGLHAPIPQLSPDIADVADNGETDSSSWFGDQFNAVATWTDQLFGAPIPQARSGAVTPDFSVTPRRS